MKPTSLFIYLKTAVKYLSIFTHLSKMLQKLYYTKSVASKKGSFKLHPFGWFSAFW